MSADAAAMSQTQRPNYQAILWGGLIAGILDISAACVTAAILNGRSPMTVLQSVASGLLKANAYKGGARSAAIGLALHFFIAYVWCTVFYLASRQLAVLLRNPVVTGLLYGIFVYLMMYGIVLPLTFHRNFFTSPRIVIIAVLTHMFCVGLPISVIVSRFSRERSIDEKA
jgi:uncharacterized membrane protein YagU involved in acid resistance